MTEEQLLARLDAFIGRELSRQNARAQAILGKLGVTAHVALDDEGALSVSGEVVCLSSDFPWCAASLHPRRGRERVVLARGKTVAFQIEPTADIERTRMYRHTFTAGPYAVPEGAEAGTLDLMFRDEGGVIFGNRWRLDFRGAEGREPPGSAARRAPPGGVQRDRAAASPASEEESARSRRETEAGRPEEAGEEDAAGTPDSGAKDDPEAGGEGEEP